MNETSPIKTMKQLRLITSMFVICPILYVGMTYLFQQAGGIEKTDPETLSKMTGALALVFLTQIGFAYFFPRLLSSVAAGGEKFQTYLKVVIVQLAMLESGAVFGFVLGLMGSQIIVPICFSVVSIFFILNIFSSEERMERFSRQ